MAGEPGNLTIEFYPTTAVFSAVLTDTSSTVSFTQNDCRVAQNYLIYETSEIDLIVLTSLTVTAYGHQYNISISNSTTVVNLPTQNLYAWSWTPSEYDGAQITTCYTTTPTPTTSDYIYYANGVTIPSNTIFYSGIGGSFYTTSNTPIASATSNSITLTGDGSNNASGGSN